MFNWLSKIISNNKKNNTPCEELLQLVPKEELQDATYYRNQAYKFIEEEKFDEAASSYRKAVKLAPDDTDTLSRLGYVFYIQRKLDEAIPYFRQALRINPSIAATHYLLGATFQLQGNDKKAIEYFEQAIRLQPDYEIAYNGLCQVLNKIGEVNRAIEIGTRTLLTYPTFHDLHCLLGEIFETRAEWNNAATHFQHALSLQPDNADTYYKLGIAFHRQHQLNQAKECYERALILRPELVAAHFGLGDILRIQGTLNEAETSYRRILPIVSYEMKADVHCNLGIVLELQGKWDIAVEHYHQALLINPHHIATYNNLGHALFQQGKLETAAENFRKALSYGHDEHAFTNLLLALSFSAASSEEYMEEAKKYGVAIQQKATSYSNWPVCSKGTENQVLRVGFVSGDFKNHPVTFFLESIVKHINPDMVELVAYSQTPNENEATERIKPYFAEWNAISGITDKETAQKIHSDNIHILIDLSGHTANNRLPLFAWKAAPVQATWLGYWASTGVKEIDYVLTDHISVPDHHRQRFSEAVWYLPDTRLCFTPPTGFEELPSTPLPAYANGHVTFGCFQNLPKLNDDVLITWGQILCSLIDSKLRIQNKQMLDPIMRQQLLRRLLKVGIAPERVELIGPMDRNAYLEAHAEVDILLDTFPYPGGTTTCEATWMGVPTITLAGDTMLARQGASLLTCAGLSEWVASNQKEYVDKAISFSSDLEKLALLRKNLRANVVNSPMFNASRFARQFESAMQKMWAIKRAENKSALCQM